MLSTSLEINGWQGTERFDTAHHSNRSSLFGRSGCQEIESYSGCQVRRAIKRCYSSFAAATAKHLDTGVTLRQR
jgi:hypothetical protein